MRRLSIMAIVLSIFVSACQSNVEGQYDREENKSGARLKTNREAGGPENGVIRDRKMNDQNPNFLNLDGNRTRNDMGKDIDKARQVIDGTKDFTPGAIWINGEDMWVTVYQKGNLTDRDKLKAQSRVRKLLIKALPRYDIEVRVREDRT